MKKHMASGAIFNHCKVIMAIAFTFTFSMCNAASKEPANDITKTDDIAGKQAPKPSETDAAVSSTSSIKSRDKNNFKGDKISFPVNIPGNKINLANTPITKGAEVCIPIRTDLKVISDMDDGSKIVTVKGVMDVKNCNAPTESLYGIPIILTEETIKTFSPSHNGFTYGGIIVPYKYHYSGSKSFDGGSTLAPFAGYRFDRYGYAYGLKLIAFAGLAKIDVTQTVNDEPVTQSLSGFSYGAGIIGEIDEAIQIGIVFGKDTVNESSHYKDNSKPWISLAIGYSFAN